jgi:two-component system sensor histidine kinase CpxA
VRTFFLQLFLTFWVATIGIFVTATIVFPNQDPGSPEAINAAGFASAERLTLFAVARYREQGCSGIAELGPVFVLATRNGGTLCGVRLSDQERQVLLSANSTGAAAGRMIGGEWLQAHEITDSNGEEWLLLQRLDGVRRSWFPRLPRSALPISIAVTFCFALLLTRPVRALSLAFRRFSSGDLTVRVAVSRRRWSGVGGADMRSLMLDFNHMADRVNELVDAQKLLVRDISHELRSPLARLRLALEMTREESATDLPSLDRMELESERINELVGQMLTLSLMESTKDIGSTERFEVNELLEEMLPDMEFEAAARSSSVLLRVGRVRRTMVGNRDLVRSALENVIRNAIRFTAKGTAVEIELEDCPQMPIVKTRSELQGETILIRVDDRGPGVPEVNVPHLFRAFYRTDTARRDSTGGFGVGLSIAERAVHLHHGTISATNREAGGLRVEIILPVV